MMHQIFGDIFKDGKLWKAIGLNLQCQATGENFQKTLSNFRIAAKKALQDLSFTCAYKQ